MPSLENLKKRAKQYVRWHRERHHPVAEIIRAGLPSYRHLDDAQVLAATFKLTDAQALLAHELGFETWEGLRQGLQAMPDKTPHFSELPKLLSVEPQLLVGDIPASCQFYERLRFSIAFTYGDPPFYAQVHRDGVRLNLRHVDTPLVDASLHEAQDLLSASINVDDVKALFLEYQASGIDFHQNLRTEPWGARTFILRDPDGNLLLFAGPGERAS